MAGRGPGASEKEVLGHTRGRIVQAGIPVAHRLAETAREAAQARHADAPFFDGGLAPQFAPPARQTRPASRTTLATLALVALLIGHRAGRAAATRERRLGDES